MLGHNSSEKGVGTCRRDANVKTDVSSDKKKIRKEYVKEEDWQYHQWQKR